MPAYKPIEERFWNKVEKRGPVPSYNKSLGRCWIWTGFRMPFGHGQIGGERGQGLMLVHRLSYELHKGAIPEALTIDHLCRIPYCVNPDHLEAVTHRENTMRGNNQVADRARQTHCKNGHKLSGTNVRRNSTSGSRICVKCNREWWRKYRKKTR